MLEAEARQDVIKGWSTRVDQCWLGYVRGQYPSWGQLLRKCLDGPARLSAR